MSTLLITGASRGIGRETALKLASDSSFKKIVVNCRENEAALLGTVSLMREITEALIIPSVGDVGDMGYVRRLRESCGPVDVLINNAGISRTGLFTETDPAVWDEVIRTNLTSVFNTCRVFAPDMVSNKWGRIINVSSVWGLVGASCEVAYSASKGGINAFTRALAKELAPSGVSVNAIAFGAVDTEMNANLNEEEKRALAEEIPFCRMASPREAAEAIARLVSMPAYFTGEVVRFDGAWQ
ncbi:MAG: SDR family NAD(P)-dependent oxidoreductase [Clostridiales bacterium]|nr:SDR family NAD(P)-dependent oxidoreductase [Clostridiales bacterium]